MFSEMKKEIIEAGILLDRYELVSLTCGNLSVRMPTGEILVTPSGMMYEKMVEDDMIVMDIDGNVIEGTIDMGFDTVKYVGNGHAVILSQHGVMTVGKDLNQALYAAVYLEEAAKCYLAARAACVNGEIKQMSDAQIQQMVDVFQY